MGGASLAAMARVICKNGIKKEGSLSPSDGEDGYKIHTNGL